MNASALSTTSVPPRLVHFRLNRNTVIATGVVVFHVAVLWGLQNGLLRRAVEVFVPIEILSQIITPPAPSVAPPAPAPVPPAPLRQPEPRRSEPRPLPAPLPAAIADPTPTPNSPTAVLAPQPAAPPVAAPVAAPVPAVAAPPAAPAPAPSRIEPPSSNADYLQNPKPTYPPISKRLGEQGKVMLRVLIGADGAAKAAEISQSSGFERLDQAALSTVLKWRYLPGKRGGVPEAMWFNVPINFVLE